ncbi:MAG: fumarate hydratase, partial [Candidatus Pacearchaeota archaeon]|nr:fumarate hydratase [Candidatus Pacearchaeota archaeon]
MAQKDIMQGIVQLIRKAETELPKDVIVALKHAYELEKGIAKTQLEVMLKNIDVARKTGRPICQDTGVQTFFVKVGLDFPHINTLKNLITDGVKKATVVVPLRP